MAVVGRSANSGSKTVGKKKKSSKQDEVDPILQYPLSYFL